MMAVRSEDLTAPKHFLQPKRVAGFLNLPPPEKEGDNGFPLPKGRQRVPRSWVPPFNKGGQGGFKPAPNRRFVL